MKRGKIIVIEGTDCSGKETQTSLLFQHLLRNGKKVERFGFPNYESPTGRIVGGPYLGKPYIGNCYFKEGPVEVDPKVAALYYAADRRYNIKKINEYLDAGYDVILDRYVESNMGHQGAKIFDKEKRLELYKWLEKLEYDLLELPKPDLTIFLYMPYQQVSKLKATRKESEDLAEQDANHLKNAEHTYLELADIYNFITVNCMEDNHLRKIEDINAEIIEIVENYTKD